MNSTRHVILGLFFFTAMIVLGTITIVLSDTWNPFKQQRWIDVQFANVDGLLPGDPVLIYGTKVGSVKEITLDMDAPDAARRLRVTIALSCRASESARGRAWGWIASANFASTSASIRSVFASLPMAFA